MDDTQIIEYFFARSEQAIRALSDRYGSLCRSIALHILNNPQDAEECVNDAYLAVWNNIPPARPDPLSAYVCRIVRNLALKRYHANTAAKRNSHYDLALEELVDCLPSTGSVEEEIEARELARLLNAFLATLEPQSRILFVRRYWYADSISDLAALFHTGKHNISVRLSRIRKALREYLRKEGISL